MDDAFKQKIFGLVEKEVNFKLSKVDPDKDILEQVSFDSMQLVAIIAKLETEFQIELPISVMEVRTVNEFFNIIEKEFEGKKFNV